MNITTKPVEYFDGKQKCIGYLAWDESVASKRPCVIIAHAWGGRDDFAENKAVQMAAMGYVGFAIDMYGDNALPGSVDEKMAAMKPFTSDRKALLERVSAGFEACKKLEPVDADHIALMGYCFGGMCGLDLARSGADLKALISFHGLLGAPDFPAKKIKAKVLIAHGWDDDMVPPSDVITMQAELAKSSCDYQIHGYGNTGHAFTVNGLQEDSERRSWDSAMALLSEVFSAHGTV